MKINNNIQALNAYRNLYQNQQATSKNLEKLSSGLRINRAADDAAGLAISEKMRSQIRGLKMAERNAMDAISLMQTSEGAMQEVHEMLQRMRELAVQGANDTNTDQDREEIQKEIDQLLTEIDSVAEKTEFNTRKLLNGESAVLTTYNEGKNVSNIVGEPTVVNPNVRSGDYGLSTSGLEFVREIKQPAAGLGKDAAIAFADPSAGNQLGTYTINVRSYNENADTGVRSATIEVIGPDGLPKDERIAVEVGQAGDTVEIGGLSIPLESIDKSGTVKVSLEVKANFAVWQGSETNDTFRPVDFDKELTTVNGKVTHGGMEFKFDSSIQESLGYLDGFKQDTLDEALGLINAATDTSTLGIAIIDGSEEDIVLALEADVLSEYNTQTGMTVATYGDLPADLRAGVNLIAKQIATAVQSVPTEPAPADADLLAAGKTAIANFNTSTPQTEFSVINNALAFQIGPNTNQNVMIDVPELNIVELGIDQIRVTTQTEANDAIFALDSAIQQVSSIRAKLGAVQNRMEHTINNLQVTHENLTSSESRIRDADMALEMTEFTRNNILNQSATAMLAQANQLPQGVLQLLQ
ncbi:flagellin [Paenalkalicoccus suaedae]|uniref:Flagellin n=1 Tax=Paenalkalicoccus suaedae TaxID=2592382 RepID=A0A859FFK8_9BACI|nr:flagellin [Paenalkalicoccus suaedae]QKS70995.1 flagellin [Paenalkalicoccus suaedae]